MNTTQLAERFEYEEWRVLIYLSWDELEHRFAGRAELFLRGRFRCRVGLPGEFELPEEAVGFLRARAKTFIEDWRQREHDADSEFSEL